MVKFVCVSCNYRFESDKTEACPYCNSKSVEKEQSAEEILEEVGDLIRE